MSRPTSGQLAFPLTVPPLAPQARQELLGLMRFDWQADAACAGILTGAADPFYPEPITGTNRIANSVNEVAKAVCLDCPVRISCLAAALVTNETHGVWGGASPTDRDRIKVNLALGDPVGVALRANIRPKRSAA
ncbi:MAG: putative transcriptional regulator [Frankiales bacterium]|nr:putative transcriptional regulator [Frankiales bacterium]